MPYNKFFNQDIYTLHNNYSGVSKINHTTQPSADDYEYKYTLHPSCFYYRDTCTRNGDAYNIVSNNENDDVLCAMHKNDHHSYGEIIKAVKHNNYKKNWNHAK